MRGESRREERESWWGEVMGERERVGGERCRGRAGEGRESWWGGRGERDGGSMRERKSGVGATLEVCLCWHQCWVLYLQLDIWSQYTISCSCSNRKMSITPLIMSGAECVRTKMHNNTNSHNVVRNRVTCSRKVM